jgi:5-methyltetrahydrofolate--homocysteine methyltransferase
MDLAEAQLAVRAAAATGLPVVASMAFDVGGRTIMGTTPDEAVSGLALGASGLAEAGACVVGANCGTVTPKEMESIIEAMAAATDRPLIAKPNAGRPRLEGGRTVHDGTPQDLAASVERFVALGVRMIGGCCGTGPDFIRAAAEVLKRIT